MTGRFVFINNANSQNIFYGNNPWTPLYRTWWYGSHKEPGDMPPEFEAAMTQINHGDPRQRDALFVKTAMDHIKARPDLFLLRSVNRVRVFMGFDTFTSAQVARSNKKLGALVLAIDAGLYLLVTMLALLLPRRGPLPGQGLGRADEERRPGGGRSPGVGRRSQADDLPAPGHLVPLRLPLLPRLLAPPPSTSRPPPWSA